jgi:2-polyprenyl-3-methyl-5-hydroxy-6-metoxy-1,4-benzoquinol methylase
MDTIRATQTSCKVCGNTVWQNIDTLTSGIWDKQAKELKRQVLCFPIGQCQHCSHVQITTPYTDAIFSALYFSNTSEPDMWCDTPEGEKSPYEEMFAFFASYIKMGAHIVDFGAGGGATLKHIDSQFKESSIKLSSVDFHDHIKSNAVEHITANLNQLETIQPHFAKYPINIAISTHVLEHIVEPVRYLTQISECLVEDGIIFIEVPDCSPDAFTDNLGVTNIIHGQHIHYYTKDSLKLVAEKAGLKIINQQQLQTGAIPRLLVLLKKVTTAKISNHSVIKYSAELAVEQRFSQYNSYLSALFSQIQQKLTRQEKVGLWGIGGDFYLLIQLYPSILKAIENQQIMLYDYGLAGHTFARQEILSSTGLELVANTVYIVPIYAPTRERMTKLSQNWHAQIIDPYSEFE